jgi:alkyl sulfatase BDS1-like metallo-beta-lactamase superfamily hydrolase
VRAEPLVLSLRVTFQRDAYSDLVESYQLVIDDEPSTVEVASRAVTTLPGRDPAAAMTLRTSAGTLVALLRGERTAEDALADQASAVEGERGALDRFLAAFAYPAELVEEPATA